MTTVETSVGPAEIHLDRPTTSVRGVVILGHGAGGGIDAPDLRAVLSSAIAEDWAVGRVVQPYRLAGRRAPPRAPQLDAAWLAAVTVIRRRRGLGSVPLIVGGRSSGARVACRTAVDSGAAGVIALAFPLRPPGRADVDRSEELEQAGVPVLVVQGERDPFGGSRDIATVRGDHLEVCAVPEADHSLRRKPALDAIVAVVGPWLRRFS